MIDFSSQFNMLFLQGFGFIFCLVLLFFCSRFYNHKLIKLIKVNKKLSKMLAKTQTTNQLSEQARQLLLQKQQVSQDQLEEKVQERTLELNIALHELEEVNSELKQKNTLDELTGLFNRRSYDQRILAE
ncbi:MAG: hypothetical protein JJV99_06980, partial [Colwellia sp.]|nr:hypothetical protein [Colwellia sp.]